MAAYVFESLDHQSIKDLSLEKFDEFEEMLSGLLVSLMNKQIKQGLFKDYLEVSEELRTPRGSINFSDSIKSNAFMKKSLICDFDEYTENNISNQIIKATLISMLGNDNVNNKSKEKIKNILNYLSAVDIVDLRYVTIKNTKASNQYKNYRFMLFICQLYKEQSIFLEDKENYSISSFLGIKSYHDLYENFVLSYFRKEHPHLKASGTNMRWNTEEDSLLPMMKTDISLFKDEEVLIIDTKYYTDMYTKNNYVERIRSSHMYQIFAYVYNYSTQNNIKTSGMLLYAETNHERRMDIHEKVSDFDLYFRSLNLNTEFKNIMIQLDEIANL